MSAPIVPIIFIFFLFFPLTGSATQWSLTPNRSGLFTIKFNSLPLVSAKYVGWNKNWKWAGPKTHIITSDDNNLIFQGKINNFNTEFSGSIKNSHNKAQWNYQWNINSAYPDAIGFGIEFNINTEIPQSKQLSYPELLDNNKGWTWTVPNGKTITVEFTPPLASIYFERNKKNKIRAFIFKDIKPGNKATTMTVTLPDNTIIYKSIYGRHTIPDTENWIKGILDWESSPVDLSFLNKPEIPAGKHGFLKSMGEILEFEDGTKVRFWGTNIQASTIFKTSKENVRLHAKRLSKLGFNLIRIHHHDSHWVKPNIFGLKVNNTLKLDDKMLDKIDWWIKSLKDEGIYVWIDLHVGRRFTKNDNIKAFKEIQKYNNRTQGKGFIYFNSDLEKRLKEFNQAYLSHINPYTKLALKDEPAVVTMLITNENDITHHFGNLLLPDKNVPSHNRRYMKAARIFAQQYGLPEKLTWRSWEQGSSKLFLNDMEHRFNLRMISHLRKLGVKVPLVTTNFWGSEPLSSLPALTDSDIIDVHSYGGPGELETNPLYRANMLNWISAANIMGKPLSITEWNVAPFPVTDRYVIPLYLAGISSLQGWDSLMQYGYSQLPLNQKGKPSNWHLYNDPGLLSTMPAAALLYRQNHVQEARNTYVFNPPTEKFFNNRIDPRTSSTLRTLTEISKLLIDIPNTRELPWVKSTPTPKNYKIIREINHNFIANNTNKIVSDTGELSRSWTEGLFTINSKRSQIASGWLSGKKIQLNDVEFNIKTPHAVVAVQSMNKHAIVDSRNILISLSARSVPLRTNKLPFYSEPVRGKISIRAPGNLKLFKLNPDGHRQKIETKYINNTYNIILDNRVDTYWLHLTDDK